MLRPSTFVLSRRNQSARATLALGCALALGTGCAKSRDAGTAMFTSGSGTSGGSTVAADGSAPVALSGTFVGGSGLFVFPDPVDAGDAGPCDGGACADFPATTAIDMNGPPPGNPSTLFGAVGTGSPTDGPCIAEPADGALYPYNWLRPRILWTPGTKAQTVFEVRLHADLEANDYVVYTTKNYWVLDLPTWQAIAGVPGQDKGTLVGKPISVTVRASTGSGAPSVSTTVHFTIAPAIAAGSLVYWTTASFDTNATTTTLQGFRVGDEGTTPALTPLQVQQTVWATSVDGGGFPSEKSPQQVGCIGCHTATPDGKYVGFTAQWPWPNAIASIEADSGTAVGAAPPWLTPGAIDNLSPNVNDQNYLGGTHVQPTNNVDNVMLGIQTFSAAHYAPGDRIEVTTVGAALDQPNKEPIQPSGVTSQLIWIDLEFTGLTDGGRPSAAPLAPNNGGWGILARTGDTQSAGAPDWSHDGKTIAYTSVAGGTMDGRLQKAGSGSADIATIPYANRDGGASAPLPGASDPMYNEYFPSFSPDDALIAFNRVDRAVKMYSEPSAEVYVVPVKGSATATPVRLVANDPVTCTRLTSPGVQNTWPKWAPNPVPSGVDGGADGGPPLPAPQTIDGVTYYWLTFSSSRSTTAGAVPASGATPAVAGRQQLYVTGVTVDAAGTIKTYPPIYLWNQSDQVNNLIPAWGEFAIPPGKALPPPPPAPNPPK